MGRGRTGEGNGVALRRPRRQGQAAYGRRLRRPLTPRLLGPDGLISKGSSIPSSGRGESARTRRKSCGLWDLLQEGHVEVATLAPDGRDLRRDGRHEAQCTVAVREGADGSDAALEFGVEALQSIVGSDPRPVSMREVIEPCCGSKAILQTRYSLGKLSTEPVGKRVEGLVGKLAATGLEDPAEFASNASPQPPGCLVQHVACEVNRAALMRHLRELAARVSGSLCKRRRG